MNKNTENDKDDRKKPAIYGEQLLAMLESGEVGEKVSVIVSPRLRHPKAKVDRRTGARRPVITVDAPTAGEEAKQELRVNAVLGLIHECTGKKPSWNSLAKIFIVEVNASELKRLAEDSRIESISPNRVLGGG